MEISSKVDVYLAFEPDGSKVEKPEPIKVVSTGERDMVDITIDGHRRRVAASHLIAAVEAALKSK